MYRAGSIGDFICNILSDGFFFVDFCGKRFKRLLIESKSFVHITIEVCVTLIGDRKGHEVFTLRFEFPVGLHLFLNA